MYFIFKEGKYSWKVIVFICPGF